MQTSNIISWEERYDPEGFKRGAPRTKEAAMALEIADLRDKIKQLESDLDKAQDEINCAESALEAFSCEFEDEVFDQGFDCLGDFVHALWEASNKQRDNQLPEIAAQFETDNGYCVGRTDAPVKRVEHQDDGSLTVIINHWPQYVIRQLTYQEWKDKIGDRQMFTIFEAINFVEKTYGIGVN